MRLVLASQSPRRRELLAALAPEFEVAPADLEETMTGHARADAVRLSLEKAWAIAAKQPGTVVVGSDTIVHLGGACYGKPADAADAFRMWRELRGRSHTVTTGVAVVAGGREFAGASQAEVTLAELSDDEVRALIATGIPIDKAGSYAIQEGEPPVVTRLQGCYCCVVGLPLWRLRGLLEVVGVVCRDPGATFERCRQCPERPPEPRDD